MSSALADPGPAAAAAVLFVLLAAWCLANRRVDLSLAALGLYLGLLDGYLKLRTGSSLITLARDVLVAAIAAGALVRAITSHQPLPLPPLGGLVLAFSAVVLVELFNPAGPGLGVGAGGVRQHVEFVPLFFLGYAFVRRETQVQKVLLVFILCAAAGGVVSYIQSRLTPQQLATWGPGYSERVLGTGPFQGAPRVAYDAAGNPSVRPFGLGSDLGGGAVAASLALPALIAMLMVARGRLRAGLAVLGIGIGLAVATSGTRAALVTTAISVVAFALIAVASRNALRVVAGLAVGAVLVYGAFDFLGPSNSTAQRARSIAPTKVLQTFTAERGGSVSKFTDYVSRYPLGLGVGSVGPAALALGNHTDTGGQALNSETEWNFLVLEVGVAGIALFIALNLRLMALALTRIRRIADQTLRLQLAALAAPLFGLAVAGFAGPTTASVPPAPYFWFVAGVLSYWLVGVRRGVLGGAGVADAAVPAREPAPAHRAEREPALRSSAPDAA